MAARKPLSFDVHRSPPAPVEVAAEPKSPALVQPAEARQQVGARVTATTYRRLKAKAALEGVAVQTLVEQAINEFLSAHG